MRRRLRLWLSLVGLSVLLVAALAPWRAAPPRATDASVARDSADSPDERPRGLAGAAREPRPRQAPVTVRLHCDGGFPVDGDFVVELSVGSRVLDCRVHLDGGQAAASVDGEDELLGRLATSTPSPSTIELRFDAAPYGPLSVVARRTDTRAPYLFAEPVVVRIPVVELVDVRLGVRSDEARVAVELASDVALRRARVQLLRGDELLSSDDIVSGRGGSQTTIRGLLSCSPGTTTVRVASYEPGSTVLGLPASQTVSLEAGKLERIRFVAPRGTPVTFVARGSDGEPVPFGLSVWSTGADGRRDFVDVGSSVETRGGGRFWTARLRPGQYSGLGRPDVRFAAAWTNFTVTDDPSSVQFDVRDEGLHVRLVLRGRDGLPLANTALNLNRVAHRLEDAIALPTTTDPDGTVVTPAIPSGRYRVVVWKHAVSREIEIVDVGPYDLTIPVESTEGPRGEVAGVVRLPGGEPCAFSVVYLESESGWSRVADTDGVGGFQFPSVAPGTYAVVVPSSWFSAHAFRTSRTIVRLEAQHRVSTSIQLESR